MAWNLKRIQNSKRIRDCLRIQDSSGFTFTYGKIAFLVDIFRIQDISTCFEFSEGLEITKRLENALESKTVPALSSLKGKLLFSRKILQDSRYF